MYTQKEHFDKEEKAINWFANKNSLLFKKSPSTNDVYDGWITSPKGRYIIEAKVRRDTTAETINNWGGPLLEFKKLNYIIEFKEVNEHAEEILYLNFLKDELQIYKLPSDPSLYSWELKLLPKRSYGKKIMVWKWITKLNNEYKIHTVKYK